MKKLINLLLGVFVVLSLLITFSCSDDNSTKPSQVEVPILSHPAGTYNTFLQVVISCPSPESIIYYTTDGSEPTESSHHYQTPIDIKKTTTIQARAFKQNVQPSGIITVQYDLELPTVATPTFSLPADTYNFSQNIEIMCSTPNVEIYYTLDESEPTELSEIYTSPINISSNAILKAKAFKTDYFPSETEIGEYFIDYPAPTNPIPEDNANDISVAVTLNWETQLTKKKDRDLAFNVYLGTSSNPALVSENQTEQSYTPLDLANETTYYWKVIAVDGEIEVESPVWSFTTESAIKNFVFVPGGTFTMGDTHGVGWPIESPTHQVTLNSFYICKYEVTQAEYEAVIGENPSYSVGENKPVEFVSWYDVVEYCNALSIKDGLTPCYDTGDWTCDFSANGYRLPTEAEWEYAARGATNTPDYLYAGSDDIESVAWYGSNADDTTHNVGTKAPNSLGIYDMTGNVFEWCYDWHDYYNENAQTNPVGATNGFYRVIRGGSVAFSPIKCRIAYRDSYLSVDHNNEDLDIGFRLVRTSE